MPWWLRDSQPRPSHYHLHRIRTLSEVHRISRTEQLMILFSEMPESLWTAEASIFMTCVTLTLQKTFSQECTRRRCKDMPSSRRLTKSSTENRARELQIVYSIMRRFSRITKCADSEEKHWFHEFTDKESHRIEEAYVLSFLQRFDLKFDVHLRNFAAEYLALQQCLPVYEKARITNPKC